MLVEGARICDHYNHADAATQTYKDKGVEAECGKIQNNLKQNQKV